ncbi:branched-chain amino acid ABC transporter permease [Bosea vaviloviae]|uniref:Branched-chain amino acid ABC transporter permease n=1 Tax=Bosea vaviloviae TaxID=1526658 RepID=A0A1D7UC26_9HYPH|nr:branched-chain amino acid ABC transporter permease [Bosea vaviloviae]AOO84919.1 branched-chain amino acid ABC transporter permease [Bosea vaviloviae]
MPYRLSDRHLVVAALAGVIVLLGWLLPNAYFLRIATLVWIFALATLGLTVLIGQAGQVSLGQAGFFGIGAYSAAILPTHFGVSPLVTPIVGAFISGALAFVVGRPILRLKGHYLAIATLGLGFLISMVLTNEAGWTGGPDGMQVQRPVVFGMNLRQPAAWYWISAISLLIGGWLVLNLDGTTTGRAFRALRDSEVAASVMGIDVSRMKLRAFVLAAIYASFAGSLLGLSNGFVTPDQSSFLQSVEMVTMSVLGGVHSVVGAIVGSAILVLLPQMLTVMQDYETLVLGAIVVVVMIFLPGGVVPALAALTKRRTR